MDRRCFLRSACCILPAFGGCLGDGDAGDTAGKSPSSPRPVSPSPTPTPTDPCQRDLDRIDASRFTVQSAPLDGFELMVAEHSIPHGRTMTARLTNVADDTRQSGARTKYDVERRTTDGWQSVFRKPKYEAWVSEAIGHEPGEGFRWTMEFTQDGLTSTGQARPDYHVCSPVQPGTYRFLYWGVGEPDQAIAVQFSVTQD